MKPGLFSRYRALVAGTAAFAVLLACCAVPVRRPDSVREWRAPAHSKVLADTGTFGRSATLLAKKSRVDPRPAVAVVTPPSPPRSTVSLVLRSAGSNPPAPTRRRFRRVTHDADGDPPA